MHTLSAVQLSQKIRSRELAPHEVVIAFIKRIDATNPHINAVSYRRDEAVLAEARRLSDRIARAGVESLPEFAGVPIAIKALTTVFGWPASGCSRAKKDSRGKVTHDAVGALERAGFLLLCQTTSPEFGSIPVTESKLYGVTRNPWSLESTPGGSSGGAAAAVAAQMVPLAEASDGGGSIRIPASCCGLVGLKPSRGRIWCGPEYCNCELGVKGCLTRTVEDTAAVLDIMTSNDAAQWVLAPASERPFRSEVGRPPGQLRIGFTTSSPLSSAVEPACARAVLRTVERLQDLGHEVYEAAPEWQPVEVFVESFLTVWGSIMAEVEVHDESLIEPHNRFLRERARSQSAVDLRRAWNELQKISRRIISAWPDRFEVLLTPTMAMEPPEAGIALAAAEKDPQAPLYNNFDMVPFTPWFNVTGQPAVSLPLHVSEAGLPIGVQLVGPPRGEALLIRLAAQLEQAVGWQLPSAFGF